MFTKPRTQLKVHVVRHVVVGTVARIERHVLAVEAAGITFTNDRCRALGAHPWVLLAPQQKEGQGPGQHVQRLEDCHIGAPSSLNDLGESVERVGMLRRFADRRHKGLVHHVIVLVDPLEDRTNTKFRRVKRPRGNGAPDLLQGPQDGARLRAFCGLRHDVTQLLRSWGRARLLLFEAARRVEHHEAMDKFGLASSGEEGHKRTDGVADKNRRAAHHVLEEAAYLSRPDFASVADNCPRTPPVPKEIEREDAVPAGRQGWYLISPMVRARAETMHEHHGLPSGWASDKVCALERSKRAIRPGPSPSLPPLRSQFHAHPTSAVLFQLDV
mmetsp:Transcript_44629/g.123686  ORF Transcript_44629/g.123686 Transcript_44629/m.123686 type:complete len:328 (+) Transcript_44629:149-1132(+)